MNLNDRFNLLTTPVSCSFDGGQTQASAFFYVRLAPLKDPSPTGPQWRTIENTWLVTNRHVVLQRTPERENVANLLTFNLRRLAGDKLQWAPVDIAKNDLTTRLRLHADSIVDVALVQVHDLLSERFSQKDAGYIQHYPVSREDFASERNILVETSDDVVIAGYPRGFYDEVNLFPIVKAGIIASRWGANFGGKPFFLIDAKLFPGSSGSIVVSKPINVRTSGDRLLYSKEKQFAFLGIYSGEPFREGRAIEAGDLIVRERLGFDVGIVWYASLVEEITENGVQHQPGPQ